MQTFDQNEFFPAHWTFTFVIKKPLNDAADMIMMIAKVIVRPNNSVFVFIFVKTYGAVWSLFLVLHWFRRAKIYFILIPFFFIRTRDAT